MTTKVSGRIAGRSVFEPFSAHRASTGLKVKGINFPQPQRKVGRLLEEPTHKKRGRDMG